MAAGIPADAPVLADEFLHICRMILIDVIRGSLDHSTISTRSRDCSSFIACSATTLPSYSTAMAAASSDAHGYESVTSTPRGLTPVDILSSGSEASTVAEPEGEMQVDEVFTGANHDIAGSLWLLGTVVSMGGTLSAGDVAFGYERKLRAISPTDTSKEHRGTMLAARKHHAYLAAKVLQNCGRYFGLEFTMGKSQCLETMSTRMKELIPSNDYHAYEKMKCASALTDVYASCAEGHRGANIFHESASDSITEPTRCIEDLVRDRLRKTTLCSMDRTRTRRRRVRKTKASGSGATGSGVGLNACSGTDVLPPTQPFVLHSGTPETIPAIVDPVPRAVVDATPIRIDPVTHELDRELTAEDKQRLCLCPALFTMQDGEIRVNPTAAFSGTGSLHAQIDAWLKDKNYVAAWIANRCAGKACKAIEIATACFNKPLTMTAVIPVAYEAMTKLCEAIATATGVPFCIIKEFLPDIARTISVKIALAYGAVRGDYVGEDFLELELENWRTAEGWSVSDLRGDYGGDGSIASTVPHNLVADPLSISVQDIRAESIDNRILFNQSMEYLLSLDSTDDFADLSIEASLSIDSKMERDALRHHLTNTLAGNVTGTNFFTGHDSVGTAVLPEPLTERAAPDHTEIPPGQPDTAMPDAHLLDVTMNAVNDDGEPLPKRSRPESPADAVADSGASTSAENMPVVVDLGSVTNPERQLLELDKQGRDVLPPDDTQMSQMSQSDDTSFMRSDLHEMDAIQLEILESELRMLQSRKADPRLIEAKKVEMLRWKLVVTQRRCKRQLEKQQKTTGKKYSAIASRISDAASFSSGGGESSFDGTVVPEPARPPVKASATVPPDDSSRVPLPAAPQRGNAPPSVPSPPPPRPVPPADDVASVSSGHSAMSSLNEALRQQFRGTNVAKGHWVKCLRDAMLQAREDDKTDIFEIERLTAAIQGGMASGASMSSMPTNPMATEGSDVPTELAHDEDPTQATLALLTHALTTERARNQDVIDSIRDLRRARDRAPLPPAQALRVRGNPNNIVLKLQAQLSRTMEEGVYQAPEPATEQPQTPPKSSPRSSPRSLVPVPPKLMPVPKPVAQPHLTAYHVVRNRGSYDDISPRSPRNPPVRLHSRASVEQSLSAGTGTYAPIDPATAASQALRNPTTSKQVMAQKLTDAGYERYKHDFIKNYQQHADRVEVIEQVRRDTADSGNVGVSLEQLRQSIDRHGGDGPAALQATHLELLEAAFKRHRDGVQRPNEALPCPSALDIRKHRARKLAGRDQAAFDKYMEDGALTDFFSPPTASPYVDYKGDALGSCGAQDSLSYTRWRRDILFHEFCQRPPFAVAANAQQYLQPRHMAEYSFDENRLIWDRFKLYDPTHLIHLPDAQAPEGSTAHGQERYTITRLPGTGVVKQYFIACHMLDPEPFDTEASTSRYGCPDHYFQPRELMKHGRYDQAKYRLKALIKHSRWNAHKRTNDPSAKVNFCKPILKCAPHWLKDDRVRNLWRRTQRGAAYLEVPINGFGMIDARVFESFFIDINNGLTIEEIFWVAVHSRFEDLMLNQQALNRRRQGPKARLHFVLEALATTENGRVSLDAYLLPPDFLKTLSLAPRDLQHQVTAGCFGNAKIIGVVVCVGSSVELIHPADHGVRMTANHTQDDRGPPTMVHRTIQKRVTSILYNGLGANQERLPMLSAAFSGVENEVWNDGQDNSRKYGDLDEQHYVSVDPRREDVHLYLNIAGTFTGSGTLQYCQYVRVVRSTRYENPTTGRFVSDPPAPHLRVPWKTQMQYDFTLPAAAALRSCPSIGYCKVDTITFVEQLSGYTDNRIIKFTDINLANPTSALSTETHLTDDNRSGRCERRCFACGCTTQADWTKCSNEACGALSIGIDTEGSLIVWHYGRIIGTRAQYELDRSTGVPSPEGQLYLDRLMFLQEVCRLCMVAGWNPGLGFVTSADPVILDVRGPPTVVQASSFTLSNVTRDRKGYTAWQDALPPGLNVDQHKEMRIATAARDVNELVRPQAIVSTIKFSDFTSVPSVCKVVVYDPVRKGFSNVRKFITLTESTDPAELLRLSICAQKGLCHVSMRPTYPPYGRCPPGCTFRNLGDKLVEVKLDDLVLWDYRGLASIMNHLFRSSLVLDMTTLEALIMVFVWYNTLSVRDADAREDTHEEVCYPIIHTMLADKGAASTGLAPFQLDKVHEDFHTIILTYVFGCRTKTDVLHCTDPFVDGLICEHLKHRPIEKANPAAKASKAADGSNRSRDCVLAIAGEYAVDEPASSGTGTGAPALDRAVRHTQRRLDRAGPVQEPLPAALCRPKHNLFTRGRSDEDWFAGLTRPGFAGRNKSYYLALKAPLFAATTAAAAGTGDTSHATPGFVENVFFTIFVLYLLHIAYSMIHATAVRLPMTRQQNRSTVLYSAWLQSRFTAATFLRVAAWLLTSLAYGIEPHLVRTTSTADDGNLPHIVGGGMTGMGGSSIVNDTAASSSANSVIEYTCELCVQPVNCPGAWCTSCSNKVLRLRVGGQTPEDVAFRNGPYVAVAHLFQTEDDTPDDVADTAAMVPSPRQIQLQVPEKYCPGHRDSGSSTGGSATDLDMPLLVDLPAAASADPRIHALAALSLRQQRPMDDGPQRIATSSPFVMSTTEAEFASAMGRDTTSTAAVLREAPSSDSEEEHRLAILSRGQQYPAYAGLPAMRGPQFYSIRTNTEPDIALALNAAASSRTPASAAASLPTPVTITMADAATSTDAVPSTPVPYAPSYDSPSGYLFDMLSGGSFLVNPRTLTIHLRPECYSLRNIHPTVYKICGNCLRTRGIRAAVREGNAYWF